MRFLSIKKTVTSLYAEVVLVSLLLTISVSANWQQPYAEKDTVLAKTRLDSAKALEDDGKYEASSVLFQEAADIYGALNKWAEFIDCLNGIADNAISTGNFDISDSILKVTLPLSRKELSTPSTILARTYTIAGSLADELALFRQAIAYYDTAYSEYVAVYGKEHLRVGVVLNNRSLDYRKLGEFQKALEDQEAAGGIFRQQLGEDHYYMGVVYSNLGIIYSQQDQQDRALEYQEKGLAIKLKNLPENHPVIGDSYNNISAVYIEKGDYAKALDYVRRGLQIDLETRGPDHPAVAINYDNIGIIHSYMGNYQEALDNHHTALKIRKKAFDPPHRSLSRAYNNLALTHRRMGNYDTAIRFFNDALEMNKMLVGENSGLVGGAYFDIGQAYALNGDQDRALDYYRRCIDIIHAIAGKHSRMVGLSHYGIAEVYREQGEFDRAIRHYQRSFSGFTNSFSDTAAASVPSLEDITLPREVISSIAGKAAALAARSETRSNPLPDLLLSNSNYQLALELAINVQQSYRAEASKLFLTEKYREFHEAAMDIAVRLYRMTNEDQYAQQAFTISQKSKATVLAEALQKTGALRYAGIPEELLDREKQLRSELAGLQTAVAREAEKILEGEASIKLPAMEKSLFDKKQVYESLLSNLEKNYPNYYRLRYRSSIPTLQDLHNSLPQGAVVLDYFRTPKKMFSFTISKSLFQVDERQLPENFDNLLSGFIRSIRTVDNANFVAANQQLSQILLASLLQSKVDYDKLILIPDDQLHYLPFEVLSLDSKSLEDAGLDYSQVDFLVKHLDVSYHYSAELLLQRLRRRSSSPKGLFAGFAPGFLDDQQPGEAQQLYAQNIKTETTNDQFRSLVIDGERFSALPNSIEETKTVAQLFEQSGFTSVLYLEKQATEQALKAAAPAAGYLHIASHGLLNEDNPDLSGILLSPEAAATDDGIFFAAETYGINLQADLVVLSSCESGLGPVVRGEGVMALTRGFLFSGAGNVLISLWKVSDRQTRTLMESYYRHHLNDAADGELNFADALRAAKLEMLQNPSTALPRNWAGFVLIGM